MRNWKDLRYRLEEAGCRLLASLIPRLSRGACVSFARMAGGLAYRFDARGRRVALANLESAFGAAMTPERRVEVARESYRNFARTMIDLFWAPRLTGENFTRWIKIEGLEPVQNRIREGGGGLVFICGHFGNWEWSNLAAGFFGMKPVTVAENFKNPRLTKIFKDLREISGAVLIPQENSLLRMLKVVKKGGPASLVMDLTLPPSQAATIVDVFRDPAGHGLQMCVPLLHAVLGQRGGAWLVPTEAIPERDGSVSVHVHPPVKAEPGDSLQTLTQRCWDVFEPLIRARPEFYLWAYKHFRYRPREAARTYPFYSKESGKFEKLRRETRKAIEAEATAIPRVI